MRVLRRALAASLAAVLAACAAPRPAPEARPAVEVPPAVAARARFLEGARRMIGQPYRFGGAQPGGFDCSGLVVYAAAAAGLRLPRTTDELRHAGVPVRRADLEPGDLVFMRLRRKELHVGIVLDGDRFIHAPSSGERVRIDSLGAAPYARHYLGARRVIP